MPTYEYECRKCGYRFEEFQPITAKPRSRCPHCRGKVERLIGGGIGIVFKGSGFYVNDSRRGTRAPATSTDGGADCGSKRTSSESGAQAAKEGDSRSKTGTGTAPAATSRSAPV